jgi:hypothetical protein
MLMQEKSIDCSHLVAQCAEIIELIDRRFIASAAPPALSSRQPLEMCSFIVMMLHPAG